MSDIMMNVHTRATVNTTYTMVYERSLSDLMTNVHTCFVACQIIMSDLIMNVQTCITDDTTNPCCISDHYV